MKTTVFDTKGKSVGEVELPGKVFDLPWNADLVHQVVTSLASSQRQNSAHSKDRSEVSGGGKKPWRQKGTGRARHGSRRSPIWVGGGVTFGPRNERNYERKVNQKMKIKALNTILSQKLRDNEVIFVNDIAFAKPQTKEAKAVLESLSKVKGYEGLATKIKNRAFIATDSYDENSINSFNNFSNISLDEIRNINPLDILKYKYLIIENPAESLRVLESKIK